MPASRILSRFSCLSLLVVSGAVAVGCTIETKGDGGDGPVAPTPTTCSAGGTGAITVNVSGLPAGLSAKVDVAGPSGATAVDTSKTISGAASGSYTVTAARVTKADPIVRTVYEGKVSASTFCLAGSQTQTVDITYTAIASSNGLFATNANNASGELLGFAGAQLGASGAPGAHAAAKGGMGKALAFDKDGNLWTFGPTSADAPIARFAAADLGASGEKAPDRKITTAPKCAPGYTDMAFDPSGNLWISSACDKSVVRFAAAQLAAAGDVAPDVKITGLESPAGIAFDKKGNLWVADQDKKSVLRFDAARLAASSSAAADEVITAKTAGAGDLAPSTLAFDKDGNLWATSFGGNIIYELTPTELGAAGAQSVIPSVQITVEVTALLEGIAFDESGGLWLTYSQGKIARLTASQLATSSGAGAPTIPETIVSSADIGSAGALAFYPAPAALPLFAALP